MLERVLVAAWGARSGCAPMHAAAAFAADRRRLAGSPRSGPGAAPDAGQHRARVVFVCTSHLVSRRLKRPFEICACSSATGI
jgi:hypothetical protein